MIDEDKEYTSADVLTLDDALSLAVLGYKVHAVDMQPGSFIDYNFAGFRINFDSGSSSGWRQREHDATVDWHVIDDVHVDAYKRAVAESFDEPVTIDLPGVVSKSQAWGRALRSVPPAPVVSKEWALDAGKKALAVPPPKAGLVIGAGARVWGSNPAEVARSVAVDVAASAGLGVDHASFDRAADALNEPVAAPSVGKWGKAVVPSKDKWGKPS